MRAATGAILDEVKLRRVLARMLDENEFLSPYGIRSLSRYHADHPYVFHVGGEEYRVFLPTGGVRYRHVRRQLELARADLDARQRPDHPGIAAILRYYGDDFTVECPTGSGRQMNLYQVAEEIARRLANIFAEGQGQVVVRFTAGARNSRNDPHWRDCLLFYEYFHGDNGAGLGASHQTGWTGVIARLMHLFATLKPEIFLEGGRRAVFEKVVQAQTDQTGDAARRER